MPQNGPGSLYPGLVGPSWNDLDAGVRKFHERIPLWAQGTFRVVRGKTMLARWLAKLAGLPAAGEAVAVRLMVKQEGGEEVWSRTFAGRPMTTTQLPGPRGLLAERRGPWCHFFRLEVRDGNLIYLPAGFKFWLGPVRFPLPAWLGPRIFARESPAGHPDQTHVFVEVTVPWLGLLVSYEGNVTRSEGEP